MIGPVLVLAHRDAPAEETSDNATRVDALEKVIDVA